MASSRAEEDLGRLPGELEAEERYHVRGNQGGGGRGRGKVGRGRNSGGGMNREMAISKALSKLLRHAAEEAGVKLDEEGYARLDQVLKWPRIRSLSPTFAEISTAVNDNSKQRFSMKANPALKTAPSPTSTDPSDWIIRANQGHSIAVASASLLTPITIASNNVPEIVIHGTYFAFYQPILESGGLKKMGRTHIHFSTGLPEDPQGVISGMRKDAELLIYIDIKKSLEDGNTLWWLSDNGVVLTEGDDAGILSTKYWKKVEGRKEKECGILWEDGEKVNDFPVELSSRKAPFGKGGLPKSRGHSGRGRGRGHGRGGKGPDTLTGETDGAVASSSVS